MPLPKSKGFDQEKSAKKSNKKHDMSSAVEKYFNGTITDRQFQKLQKLIIRIQSFWKGYIARKYFAKKLNDESTRIRYIKNRI